ncbi:hypothetical protein M011DRAFT_526417 [Sporormia fimetaria CBS 119925]|uniref:Ubiquitin 3 binding protein But2 C-terminal domain-containing protein n=1 Tax=Sporormia fimetaria CBS 119925 TaxID=1340428 RepID=A0A6A6VBC5_9PLEO|nr:hypothetical protein M011DRAFT_526417 [Sporormia fimetaria CBS 119925]
MLPMIRRVFAVCASLLLVVSFVSAAPHHGRSASRHHGRSASRHHGRSASGHQHPFSSAASARVPVNGHNSAYYTQVPKEEQLFKVRYLVTYPDVPAVNSHISIYLYGHIPSPLPGLSLSTFTLTGNCPTPFTISHTLTDFNRPIARHGSHYGGPLTVGANEILFDQMVMLWPPYEEGSWNCSVEATARLPDQRVLFSFGSEFVLRWPLGEGEAYVPGLFEEGEREGYLV